MKIDAEAAMKPALDERLKRSLGKYKIDRACGHTPSFRQVLRASVCHLGIMAKWGWIRAREED